MCKKENLNNERTLAMLRYQENRYKTLGNGSMCQRINAQIRQLLEMMNANNATMNATTI